MNATPGDRPLNEVMPSDEAPAGRSPLGIGERHYALDLIRGLAAFAVCQFHFMSWNEIATVQSMGTFAVYLFFILSGLTMMMVYHERFVDGISPSAARSFFRKRLARLIPLLVVVALLAGTKQALTGEIDIARAVLTGTGLMALHMPGFLSNSVGAWSLGIELAFYAVFPLIALLVTNWRQAAVAVAILVGAQHMLLWQLAGSPSFWEYYVSNLVFAPFFAFGILMSFDTTKRSASYLVPALIGFSAILSFSVFFDIDLMQSQLAYLGLTLAGALVVWATWRSHLHAALRPIASFMGDISYSLYLTHWIANDIVRLLPVSGALKWAAFSFLAMLGSFLCFRFFENPARRYFSGGGRARSTRAQF